MKNKREILLRIEEKRFQLNIIRKRIKKNKRKENSEIYLILKRKLKGNFSEENIIKTFLPVNIRYFISCKNYNFNLNKIKSIIPNNGGIFKVPTNFSIIDNPNESYKIIHQLIASLISQTYHHIKLDYSECQKLDLGTQVFLDVLLKDIFTFYKKCNNHSITRSSFKDIQGININNDDIKKLLFSVGSPAIHASNKIKFNDVITYPLCVYNRGRGDKLKNLEQKEIDTTRLVDYVLNSLERLGKELTPEKLDDLCTVIGEILINAEEHSTTNHRFSIGYFQEIDDNGSHCGIFRLSILNFGRTIYEKFKDHNCPNKAIVQRMETLSQSYTKRKFFLPQEFEEETLWTLYALQEGVTSVAPQTYKKRGNGSIQFIESFFNLKGHSISADKKSKMTILSGHTNITFNGTYSIIEKIINGDKYKFMTFNKTGDIEDKPDKNFVKYAEDYFPGTMISVEILFSEDDF